MVLACSLCKEVLRDNQSSDIGLPDLTEILGR